MTQTTLKRPARRRTGALIRIESQVMGATVATDSSMHLALFARILAAMRSGGFDVAGQADCIIDVVQELAEEGDPHQ